MWQIFVINDFVERTLLRNLFTKFPPVLRCEQYHIDLKLWCLNHIYLVDTIWLLLRNIMLVTIICYIYLDQYSEKKHYNFNHDLGVDVWIYVWYRVNGEIVHIMTVGKVSTERTITIYITINGLNKRIRNKNHYLSDKLSYFEW